MPVHPTLRAAPLLAVAALFSGVAAAQPAEQPAPSSRDADVQALRDEVRALRAEVEAARTDKKADKDTKDETPLPAPLSRSSRPLGQEAFWPWVVPPPGVSAGGYVQAQYYWNESSQDQLTQSGATLNQDRFMIRRARAQDFQGVAHFASGRRLI